MFIPVNIPSKYFPLVLYAFFSLFSGLDLGFAISMGVGYLYFKGYLDRIKPTSYFLESLEAPNGILHSVSRSRGWVLAGGALGHDAWIPVNVVDDDHPATAGRRSIWDQSSSTEASTGGTNDAVRHSYFTIPNSRTSLLRHASSSSQTPFPGSGRTLSSSGGYDAMSAFQPSAPPADVGVAAPRDIIAQRRLAALGQQHAITTQSQSLDGANINPEALDKLLVGYDDYLIFECN